MIVERRKTWISIAWLFGWHKFVATFSMFSRCNRNNKENCNEFMTYFRCAQNMRFINYSFSVVFSLVSAAVFASFRFHQNTFFIPVVVFLVLPRNLFMNLSSEKVVAFEMRVCAKFFLFHFSFFSVLKMHFRFLSSPAATTSNIAHVKPTVEKLLDKNDKTAAAAKSIFFCCCFSFRLSNNCDLWIFDLTANATDTRHSSASLWAAAARTNTFVDCVAVSLTFRKLHFVSAQMTDYVCTHFNDFLMTQKGRNEKKKMNENSLGENCHVEQTNF